MAGVLAGFGLCFAFLMFIGDLWTQDLVSLLLFLFFLFIGIVHLGYYF